MEVTVVMTRALSSSCASSMLGTALMLDMHILSEARGTGTAVHTTVLMRNRSAESKPLAQGNTAGGGAESGGTLVYHSDHPLGLPSPGQTAPSISNTRRFSPLSWFRCFLPEMTSRARPLEPLYQHQRLRERGHFLPGNQLSPTLLTSSAFPRFSDLMMTKSGQRTRLFQG